MRPLRSGIAIAAAVFLASAYITAAQQNPQAPRAPAQNTQEVGVLPVQGNVYVLVSAGGNVTAQVGPEGVLLVDTSTAAMSTSILAAVRRLSDQPIRWIINTHVHADHTGGNEMLEKAGSSTPQNTSGTARGPGSLSTGATIVAHERVLNRMSASSGEQPPPPQAAWPVATYFGEGRELFFNGEAIQVFQEPSAHTDGDSIVYFRRSDVVSTGDIYNTNSYPVIDLKTGGTINGLIAGLNHVLDITIPKDKQEGGTYVIPGHGRVSDEADVVTYRNMVTIIRDRIRDMMKRGMTLEQIKAAKPTMGYDRRWSTPSWTSDMFVEAAYRTLAPSSSPSTTQR